MNPMVRDLPRAYKGNRDVFRVSYRALSVAREDCMILEARLPLKFLSPREAILPRAMAEAAGLVAQSTPFRAYGEIADEVAGLACTPFQSRHWLSAWFEIFAADPAIEPFLVTLKDHQGAILLALPLIRRRIGPLLVLESPDLGVCDYAAPMLDPARHASLPDSVTLWRRLRAALPRADLLRLDRLCPMVGSLKNPFHAHPAARQNRFSGWLLELPDTEQAYQNGLGKSHRQSVTRHRRRFADLEGARTGAPADLAAAHADLACLDRMQETRIGDVGKQYHLNEPKVAAFYSRLVETGFLGQETLLCGLSVGSEKLAVSFAVRNGDYLVYLRLANVFGEWTRYSLGTIVTDYTIRTAIGHGIRFFDFAMGDYEYKTRFGARRLPLHNLLLPLSLKGMPAAAFWHARERLATNALLRRLAGRPARPVSDAS